LTERQTYHHVSRLQHRRYYIANNSKLTSQEL